MTRVTVDAEAMGGLLDALKEVAAWDLEPYDDVGDLQMRDFARDLLDKYGAALNPPQPEQEVIP